MPLPPDVPDGLHELALELAQEPNPRRRRQLLQARPELWVPATVTRLLRRGGASAACGHTAGRTDGPRRLAGGRAPGRRCLAGGQPACAGPYPVSQTKVRGFAGSLPEVARYLPAHGRRPGGRPHPQQLPAESDLPGPLPGSHGVRGTGAPDLRAAGRPAPPRPAGHQRGEHSLPPGPLRRGAGTVPARLQRVSGHRRAPGYRHLIEEHGYLPDQPQRLSGGPGKLPKGALLLRPGPDAGVSGSGRLQHRLPLFPARRIHPGHRTLSRRPRGLRHPGGRLSRGALRSRSVRDVPGTESD